MTTIRKGQLWMWKGLSEQTVLISLDLILERKDLKRWHTYEVWLPRHDEPGRIRFGIQSDNFILASSGWTLLSDCLEAEE